MSDTTSSTPSSSSSRSNNYNNINNNNASNVRLLPSGLVYDARLLAHAPVDQHEQDHPEHPDRLRWIYEGLHAAGLLGLFTRIRAKAATEEDVLRVHSAGHVEEMGQLHTMPSDELIARARLFNSIYLNANTAFCASLSCGGVIALASALATRSVRNGIAIVRPPGHHAEHDEPMGFCIYNNVAVAAKHLLVHYPNTIRRVMILDWDVHHGNGTQHAFYDDPDVLFVSIHRYDNGRFYPSSKEANYDYTGGKNAPGKNVNIPWPCGGFGDADYLHVFQRIVLPIATEFNPDIVIVSCGFDAAKGDPIGNCRLTPAGYAQMTYQLGCLANGKLMLALEGGYNLESIADAAIACARSLLGFAPPPIEESVPCLECLEVTAKVIEAHSPFWRNLQPAAPILKLLNNPFVLSASNMMATFRSAFLQKSFNMTRLPDLCPSETELKPEYHVFDSGIKGTFVLFVHDGPFVNASLSPGETILDTSFSNFVDPSLNLIKTFVSRQWNLVDVCLPHYEKRQHLDRYDEVRAKSDAATQTALQKSLNVILEKLYDIYFKDLPPQSFVLVLTGFASRSILHMLTLPGLNQSIRSILLICPPLSPAPFLRAPDFPNHIVDWYKSVSSVIVSDEGDPCSPIPSPPRLGKCYASGGAYVPVSHILMSHDDVLVKMVDGKYGKKKK